MDALDNKLSSFQINGLSRVTFKFFVLSKMPIILPLATCIGRSTVVQFVLGIIVIVDGFIDNYFSNIVLEQSLTLNNGLV